MPRGTAHPGPIPARWWVSLHEPLVGSSARARLEAGVVELSGQRPGWAVAFFGCLVAEVVATLPPTDPWRNLSGRLSRPGADDLVCGGLPRPPTTTGAISPRGGHRFGTWRDATDVLGPPGTADVTTDVAFAALVEDLDDEAAAVLALAGSGRQEAMGALRAVYDAVQTGSSTIGLVDELVPSGKSHRAGVRLFDVGSSALRWAMHRRWAYEGRDDAFTMVRGLQMVSSAALLDVGEQVDWASSDDLVLASLVDPGAYEDLDEGGEDF